MKTFKIRGRIIDRDSGRGIPDLFVKAFDKDCLYDDLLGEVCTDEQGYFEIVYDGRDFRELFFDNRPDLYLKVSTSTGEEVLTTKDRVRYEASDTEEFNISIFASDYIPYIPEFEIKVLRPEDFLCIRFKFINLKIDGENLKHHNTNKPAYMIVEFPPQNIAEEAFFQVAQDYPVDQSDIPPGYPNIDKNTGKETPYFVCKSRLAEPSRLVFKVPKGDTIPYTVEGLLNACSNYDLNLAPTAYPPLIYLHHKIKPWQLIKRVELLNNFDFNKVQYKKTDTIPPNIISDRDSNVLMNTENAANDWITRSSLKKYLPQEYDNSVRKEIAELYINARLFIKPKLRPPVETETSIEAPYRLLISPNKYAAWVHAKEPVVSPTTQRTELWHTRYALRLSGNVIEDDNKLKVIRAIWTRDPGFNQYVKNNLFPETNDHYNVGPPDLSLNPFRMSLDAYDRENIVYLTANQYIPNFFPTPVDVKQFMMSSFGAWMNVRGAWEPPEGLSVEEWRHRGTMGRDHYVRVVYKGYLFPFGHRASLIKITERKFHPQILYILDFAGFIFSTKVNAFAKTFDTSTQSVAASFMQTITESYNRNVANLCQSMQGLSRSEVDDLVQESQVKFSEETLTLINSSNKKTKSQLTAFVNSAENEFKVSIGNIVDAIQAVPVVNVPGNIAYLRQRMYIVVREPERIYIDSGVDRYNRQMPFSRVEITTLVTPDLNKPSQTEVDGKGQAFFWPKVGSNYFQFHIVAEDFAGNEVDFTAPLIFTESTLLNYKDTNGNIIPGKYNTIKTILYKGSSEYRSGVKPDFAGQSVMFADSSAEPGKTTFETQNIIFDAEVLPSENDHGQLKSSIDDDDFPQFYPKVHQAEVVIPSIKHLAGNSQSTNIRYADTYLNYGFHGTNNKGEVFANLVNGIDLDFNSQGDRSGGLAKPNMAISGLSRLMGPVAGNNLSQLELGNFDPKDFFSGLDAKIFGVINLWDIIETLLPNDFLSGNGEKIPRLLPDITKDKIEVGFEYKPPLKDWNNIFIASNKGKKAEFELSAKLTAYAAGGADINIYCGLKNFSIDLIGSLESFIVVHFNQIAFTTSGGKKAEVDVDLGEIEFVGILSFVETLKEFIPLDGFSDPPSLDVTEKGITASFSLSLPTVAVGVFSLQNMSLGASFILPFLVDPLSVRFNFCERQSPFLLTVSMFGGGGFFAITVDPAGVQRLEASFEFGASISVNFGVASGGVYVMAGIYFMMQANPEKAELTGYFRMGGEVDVLGIISVSIELYLELKYEFSSGKCVGRATLTIEVEVLFFSASVEISCERKFAGSNGDPTFKELMEPYVDPITVKEIKPWEIYCQAYA